MANNLVHNDYSSLKISQISLTSFIKSLKDQGSNNVGAISDLERKLIDVNEKLKRCSHKHGLAH